MDPVTAVFDRVGSGLSYVTCKYNKAIVAQITLTHMNPNYTDAEPKYLPG